MITAYFTDTEKYLKKGDFIKHFDVGSIEELLSKIKIPDKILIKANLKDISNFRFKHYADNYEYEILKDIIPLNEEFLKQDLKALYDGITSYLLLEPKEEWQKVLGKKVYLVNSRTLQRQFVDKTNCCAFMIDDLKKLIQGLKQTGFIPNSLIFKMVFDGKEIKEIERSEKNEF